jgi:hypothetical protein
MEDQQWGLGPFLSIKADKFKRHTRFNQKFICHHRPLLLSLGLGPRGGYAGRTELYLGFQSRQAESENKLSHFNFTYTYFASQVRVLRNTFLASLFRITPFTSKNNTI